MKKPEEHEITSDDPEEEIRIIEEEFLKLYLTDENFKHCFGEEIFELPPI